MLVARGLFELADPAISLWGFGADRGLSPKGRGSFHLRGSGAAGIVSSTGFQGWGILEAYSMYEFEKRVGHISGERGLYLVG